jgi:cysteine desulfurase/selenocysteine lyase
MIKDVTFERTIFQDLPLKFEAGTTNYVGAYSLKVAIDYLQNIGLDNIHKHEKQLLDLAIEKISKLPRIKVYSTSADNKISVLSFNIDGAHPFDVGILLDQFGIAVRTGKHCTHPLMQRLGIPGTARASFAMYNTVEEVERFVQAVEKILNML